MTTAKKTTSTAVTRVELGGRGVVNLECDWGVGIGGGVWSTGLLLAEHLSKHEALYDDVFRGKRLLELGSGTGLVGETFKRSCVSMCLPRATREPVCSINYQPSNPNVTVPSATVPDHPPCLPHTTGQHV